jgi:hypothetical protein
MIFVNTAVESGFSTLGCEKDEYLLFLTDLSLEDIMQCKRFEASSRSLTKTFTLACVA